jgi:hypothetical protein
MYTCTNSYNSREGKRFAFGEKIASEVYYRLPHEERVNFKQEFGSTKEDLGDDETKKVLPRYEGGFNSGTSGFSTGYTPERRWPPEKEQ